MLFGCFYFFPFIGGEEVNLINILRNLNRCPKCRKDTIFEGVIKLKDYCHNCNIKIESEKNGDGASWLTTSLVCFIVVPILFYFEINVGISVKVYIFVISPVLFCLSIIFLRIFRYLLLKKYYDLI